MKGTAEMRAKTFTTWERFVLIPVELVGALKAALVVNISSGSPFLHVYRWDEHTN